MNPLPDGQLVQNVIDGLRAVGLVRPDDRIVSRWHRRLSRGYPVPTLDRDEILDQMLPALGDLGQRTAGGVSPPAHFFPIPACLVAGNWLNRSPCALACYAQHDKCYYDNGCTYASWFCWWGPKETRHCARCNYDAACCIARCLRGNHMAGKPLYLCAGGPNAGRFITVGPPSPPNDYLDLDEAKKACCT